VALATGDKLGSTTKSKLAFESRYEHGNFKNYIVILNCELPKCSKVQSNFARQPTGNKTATSAHSDGHGHQPHPQRQLQQQHPIATAAAATATSQQKHEEIP